MAKFKAFKISITIEDPDEADQFMRGLIVARSNNSSQYFGDLIEAVNANMEAYRSALLEEQMTARQEAGL